MSTSDTPSAEKPKRRGSNQVRSSILSAILPEQFNDMISNDGRTTMSQPAMLSSSVSRGSSNGTTPKKSRRSLFFGSTKSSSPPETPASASMSGSQPEQEQSQDQNGEQMQQEGGKSITEGSSPRGDKSTASNWRQWIGGDLASEANEHKRRSRSIEGRDVSKRLEKVKQKREARSKQREVKNTEMKSLMEQVASIAATSRGIMRAQPRQSDQQRLMGEIIVLMGKMADKMSKLMLAVEPPDEDDDDTLKLEAGPMSPEDAETKAEQILSLLAAGDDTYELEWKKQEIKSILTSETMHPRKRTNDKQRALEELALGDGEDKSHRSSSGRRPSSRTKRRSKSLGVAADDKDTKSVTSSSRPTERTKSSRSNSLGRVESQNAVAAAAPKLSKRQSSRSLGKEKGKSERSSSRGAARSSSRSDGLTKKRSSRSIGAEKKKKEEAAPISPIPGPVDGSWEPLNTPEGNEDFRLVTAIT